MNHSKIILVACISAFVAITTAVLGVAGTIIGSVLSSVLYNVLSEALEKPVSDAKLPSNFEWDIAYIFPLVVILIIQLLLILAFLSEWGILPRVFLNVYLSIQGIASNNLYRILGLSLIVMSVYPFILKRDIVTRNDGILIFFIGLIFLARGFSDIGGNISQVYDMIFDFFDFPIAIIAFILLIYVIHNILSSARNSQKFSSIKSSITPNNQDDLEMKQTYERKSRINLDDLELKETHRSKSRRNRDNLELKHTHPRKGKPKRYPPKNDYKSSHRKINESSEGFHFESNDLLDDYKK